MGTFPRTENDVLTLAEEMINGLTNYTDIFPAPPLPPEVFGGVRDSYVAARNTAVTAQAGAQTATGQKEGALDDLIDVMKRELGYAENTVGKHSDQLLLLGWSPRKTPAAQSAPGQTRLLQVTRQEDDEVDLVWKAPSDGGKLLAYRVLRRERPEGPWLDIATAVETEVTLTDQPRGKEFEYRIIAVNRSGKGAPSNTVVVVL